MFRVFIIAISGLFTPVILAAEPIVFKQEFSPQHGWLNYSLTIVVLLIVILVLAKKHKPRSTDPAGCQLVEKKNLGNKTVVYVIEYEKQRFLLADNQQALAIYPLSDAVFANTVKQSSGSEYGTGLLHCVRKDGQTQEAPNATA